MEKKYLPIGSICTIKGKNRKVMVTGYYSIEYNGNIKINDYCGCTYPEGLLISDQIFSFNHSDIEKVDFVGFKNSEYGKFMSQFNMLTGNLSDEEKAANFHAQNDMILASSKSYSKLLFDENGVVMIADPIKEEPKKSQNKLKDIKFDKDGTVISVGSDDDVINPFHKEYDIVEEKQSDNSKIFSDIKFDEDGVVVSTEPKNISEIKLDEAGNVVSNSQEKPESGIQYKFDENGVLISVEEKNEEEIPPIGPGLPGYKEPEKVESDYTFDEDGVLISEGESEEVEEIPPIGPGLPGYKEPDNKSEENEKN